MTNNRWDRIRRIYEAALDLPKAEQEEFLRSECAGDANMANEVAGLLNEDFDELFLSTPPAQEGVELGGFQLCGEIGSGGTGVVYRARQESLGRDVALKLLPRHFALNEERVARFRREARAAAKLTHNHIAPIFEVGQDGDSHFIVMELVDGLDLASEIKALRAGEQTTLHNFAEPEYFRFIADLVWKCAGALAYSHGKGVVHRDVKPHNIVLDKAGSPKLVDFGLAKDSSLGSISVSERIEGTPFYMSPEQARAKKGTIDARTDVYSLGAVLYELLTLDRPYDGNTSQEVIDKILVREPTPIATKCPKVPKDLAVICAKAMEKDLAHRYESADAMGADLKRYLAGEPILARPMSLRRKSIRELRKHQVPLTAVLVLLLGFAVFHYTSIWSEERDWIPIQITLLEDEYSVSPEGVTVWAYPLDPTGQPLDQPARELGALPAEARLAHGAWRVEAKTETAILAEFTCTLFTDQEVQVEAVYLRGSAVPAVPMIRYDETLWNTEGKCILLPGLAQIRAFEVDQTEVTFGAYLTFCDTTSRVYPKCMEYVPEGRDIRDFPVVGVSREDARAYARWAGKRLPTHLELDFLHMGHEGREFPWGDEEPTESHLAPLAPVVPMKSTASREMFEYYLEHVQPVGSYPGGANPKGVLDLTGSAVLFTGTPSLAQASNTRMPWFGYILTIGRGFATYSDFEGTSTREHIDRPDSDGYSAYDVGFRCVRSIP